MKRFTVTLLLATTGLAASADASPSDISLSLVVLNKTVVLAEPVGVTVTLRNDTGAPLKLPFVPGGDVLGRWSDVPAILLDQPNQKPHYCLQDGRSVTANFPWKIEDDAILTPSGGSITVHATLDLLPPASTTPGQYRLYASYNARGMVLTQEQMDGYPPSYACLGCWKGDVSSDIQTVALSAPEGVDREAYDRLKGQPMRAPELLREFPTSTYAAYAIRGFTSEGLSRSENAAIADSLKNGAAGISRCIPCPPSVSPCVQPGNLETRGTKALDWAAEWIDLVLKAHPDIWFADELRLRLALDEIAAGKSSLGTSDLENLSKTAHPDIADRANQLLILVKERGLVK